MSTLNILTRTLANYLNKYWDGGDRATLAFDDGGVGSDFTESIWNKGKGLGTVSDNLSKEGLKEFTAASNKLIELNAARALNSEKKAASKSKISGSLIIDKAGAVVGGLMGIADSFMSNEGSAERKALLLKVTSNINSFNQQTVDTSSNTSIIDSITNQTALSTNIKASLYKGSKGAAAMNTMKGIGSSALAGAKVGGIWGAAVGALVGAAGGIGGRIRANRQARKAAEQDKLRVADATVAMLNKNNMIINQANINNALTSSLNIIAFGGSLDNLDNTSSLGHNLMSDLMDILSDKSKSKLLLNNNLLNLQFAKGGDLKVGEEIYLTPELIKYYKSLGYEFE